MGLELFKLTVFRQGYNLGFPKDALMEGKRKVADIRQNYSIPYVDSIAAAPDHLQALDRQTKMLIFNDPTPLAAESLAIKGQIANAIELVNSKITEPQSRYLNLLNVVVIAGEMNHLPNEQRHYYFRQLGTMFKLYVDRELGDKASNRDLRTKYNVDLGRKMEKAGLEEEAMVEILEKDAGLTKEEIMYVFGVIDRLNDPKEIAKAEKREKEQKIRDGF
jgi:hypothetical protein